jgi:hypothetical protein
VEAQLIDELDVIDQKLETSFFRATLACNIGMGLVVILLLINGPEILKIVQKLFS